MSSQVIHSWRQAKHTCVFLVNIARSCCRFLLQIKQPQWSKTLFYSTFQLMR